ncbi:MAG: MATE family efflux transporter, partial [Clostridiaceae bacterium]|nr:MATE family efflux transporter [Clostridiaceae bacterium]
TFFVDLFSNDPEVIKESATYLSIVAWTYPISAVTAAYGIQSRGVGRTKVPLIASASALTLNGILDYIMIYGKLGCPAMGVKGAAIATLIAKIVEFAIIIGITYWKKYELAAKLKDFNGYNSEFLARFIKPVIPVMVNELLWATGVTFYTYFYGILGTEAVATVQILDVINGIFLSLFMGLANATGAITGNLIGSGEEEIAKVYAKRTVIVGAGFAVIMSFLLIATHEFFLGFFNISSETFEICKKAVVVYAAYMIPRVVNTIVIVGVCRGGGDTVFAAIIDAGAPWLIGIPMAYLGVRVLELPVYFVIAMIYSEELIKSIVGTIRLLSGKWLHNLVKDFPDSEELSTEVQVC